MDDQHPEYRFSLAELTVSIEQLNKSKDALEARIEFLTDIWHAKQETSREDS